MSECQHVWKTYASLISVDDNFEYCSVEGCGIKKAEYQATKAVSLAQRYGMLASKSTQVASKDPFARFRRILNIDPKGPPVDYGEIEVRAATKAVARPSIRHSLQAEEQLKPRGIDSEAALNVFESLREDPPITGFSAWLPEVNTPSYTLGGLRRPIQAGPGRAEFWQTAEWWAVPHSRILPPGMYVFEHVGDRIEVVKLDGVPNYARSFVTVDLPGQWMLRGPDAETVLLCKVSA